MIGEINLKNQDMKKIGIYMMILFVFAACSRNKELVTVLLEVDRDIYNPVLEPGVTGTAWITGFYSDGSSERIPAENIKLYGHTKITSGEVDVITVDGNKIIPKEGGVATLEAVVIKDGKTFTAEKEIVVRPFYRDYHQILVMKLFMGMEGKPVERLKNEPLFKKEHEVICTFEDALEMIRKVDNFTCGIPKIIYLVGWQKGGHDHLYPSWGEVNPRLKRSQDATALESLRWLIREAKQYHTDVSLHINMLDAYKHSPLWQEYVEKDLIAKDEKGNFRSTGIAMEGDDMYNVIYPLEWNAGLAQRRIDGLIDMIPELKEAHTIHVDVFISFHYGGIPISPWHAKPENGGLTTEMYVDAQRKMFKYWREKGFDVTGEGILWSHPPGEGFYGLQPMAWWYPGELDHQMRVPETITARGMTSRTDLGDYRFGSSMQGEEIFIKDHVNLPGFLEMFCKTTLPWMYLSQHKRMAFDGDVLYYSEGIRAGEENGKKIIRKGDYVLREDDNLFVEAVWVEKEIIAYSETGYENKAWRMPETWKDINSVDIYRITMNGPELVAKNVAVKNHELTLTLEKTTSSSIVPSKNI